MIAFVRVDEKPYSTNLIKAASVLLPASFGASRRLTPGAGVSTTSDRQPNAPISMRSILVAIIGPHLRNR